MLELSQIAALVIFVAMFIAIVVGKVHRSIPTFIEYKERRDLRVEWD